MSSDDKWFDWPPDDDVMARWAHSQAEMEAEEEAMKEPREMSSEELIAEGRSMASRPVERANSPYSGIVLELASRLEASRTALRTLARVVPTSIVMPPDPQFIFEGSAAFQFLDARLFAEQELSR